MNRTLELLRKRAPVYYPELAGQEIRLRQSPLRERSTYPLFLVELATAQISRKVAVKFAPVYPENNEGLTEYRNMRTLAQRVDTTDPELGFVRALDFYPETNALITEFVEGSRLSPFLMQACSLGAKPECTQALLGYVRAAGRWLSIFHGTNLAGKGRDMPPRASFVATCDKLLTQARQRGILRELVDDLRTFFLWIEPRLVELREPVALVHGDYAPQNMAVAGGRVYVFDLQRTVAEVIYHDIAYFLVTLETLNPYPRHPFFVRTRALRLGNEFINGYSGTPLEERKRLALRVFYIRNVIQRALKQHANVLRRLPPLAERAVRTFVTRRYSPVLRREMDAIRRVL